MTQSNGEQSPGLMPEAWGRVVTGYETQAERVTELYVEPLLEAAGPIEGRRVVDLACGPGVVALEAGERGGLVTAVDFTPEMVERTDARLQEAGVENAECVVADFQSMEFDDDSFDVAVSNFGLMFASNPERTFAEVGRVLDADGRLAMTTWTEPQRQGFFAVVGAAMERAFPEFEPPGPPVWAQFAQAGALVEQLEAAGFAEPVVETVRLGWPVPSPDWFVEGIDRTSPAITYLFESLTDGQSTRFQECLHETLVDRYGDGSFELETEAHVVRADVR